MKKLFPLVLFFCAALSGRAQLTATKSQALQVDANANGKAGPGDTIRYTVVITNTSATNLLNVVFSDTVGTNTTLAGGSIKSTPVARPDSYNAIGNTILAVPAGTGVLLNDSDPDGDGVSVVGFTATSANGGTVAVTNNGGFSYLPAAGFKGADSFTYTISDGNGGSNSAVATVFVSNMVWYVNNAGANGDGRQSSPLNSFTGINGAGGAGDSDGTNDYIYLFQGSGSYGNALVLESAQKLIGAGVALVVGGTTVLGAGSRPTLGSGGAGVTCSTNNLINGLNIVATAGKGLSGTSVGSLAISNANISATGGAALDVDTGTLAVSLDSASSTNSSAEGLRLNNCGGSFVANGGAISAPAGAGILMSGGAASVTYPGNVTKNSGGRVVDISSKSGGTVSLNGALSQSSASGTGVSLVNNTGATINFMGAVTLNTSANAAFSATGGGTVSATNGSSTLVTTSGAALNVVNTTIGAGGLKFLSISANGAVSGIVLNNTGGSGGLTVTGDGGGSNNGSGGTIQNTTGPGVSLSTTASVSLNYMNITASGDDGVSGTSVTGFAMNRCNVTNNGNGLNEDGVDFGGSGVITPLGLAGSAGISNSVFSGNYYNQFTVRNSSTTASVMMVGCTFNGRAAENNNNDGLFFEVGNTGSITATCTNSTFAANKGDHFQAAAANSGNLNIKFKNNRMSGGHSTALGQGITVNAATGVAFGGYLGRVNYEIDGNTITNAISNGIIVNLGTSGGAARFNGFIRNNIIGNAAADSGSTQANGIAIDAHGNGTHTCLISGNTVQQVFDRAISVLVNDGSTNTLNLTVQNNNLAVGTNPLGSREAFYLNNASTTNNVFGQTDAATVRLDLGGAGALANTLAHGIGAPDDFRLRQRFDSRIEMPGYAGTAFDTAAVVLYLQGRNTGSAGEPGSATANNSVTVTTDGFFAGSVPLPTAF